MGVQVGVGVSVGIIVGIVVVVGTLVGVPVGVGLEMSQCNGPFTGNVSPARTLPRTMSTTANPTQPSPIGIFRTGGMGTAGRGSTGFTGAGAGTTGCGTVTRRFSLHFPGTSSRHARIRSK